MRVIISQSQPLIREQVFKPALEEEHFYNSRVVKDFDEFKDVVNKVYTRD